MTGRENVFINGAIAGLTRREVAQRKDEIVAFAKLEAFIGKPPSPCSTGMRMCLGFAVAGHAQPEALLIDEILYVAEIPAEARRRTPATQETLRTPARAELRMNENYLGSLEMQIVAVRLGAAAGRPIVELDSGDSLRVESGYLAPEPISAPIFGGTISRWNGLVCYDTAASTVSPPRVQGSGKVSFPSDRLDLIGEQYFVDIGVYGRGWADADGHHWHAYPLSAHPTPGGKGVPHPPHRCESRSADAEPA